MSNWKRLLVGADSTGVHYEISSGWDGMRSRTEFFLQVDGVHVEGVFKSAAEAREAAGDLCKERIKWNAAIA